MSTQANEAGCTVEKRTQSATFDKLALLDPTSEIMYIGSLLNGESIQEGEVLHSYAFDKQIITTVPVYMFYNNPAMDHYLSTNRNATQGYQNWVYNGIAFCAIKGG